VNNSIVVILALARGVLPLFGVVIAEKQAIIPEK